MIPDNSTSPESPQTFLRNIGYYYDRPKEVPMRRSLAFFLLLFATIGITVPLLAHHSYSAEFDVNQPQSMEGRVTAIEWTNPHVHVFVDVVDNQGRTTNWKVEVKAPHVLQANGWARDTVKVGTDVCMEGFLAKTGKPSFGSTSFTLKDTGQVLKTPRGPAIYNGTSSCSNRNAR
jgi:hypothetical protein